MPRPIVLWILLTLRPSTPLPPTVLSILDHAYPPDSPHAHVLRRLRRDALSLNELERRWRRTPPSEAHRLALDLSYSLIEGLLSLASLHEEDWTSSPSDDSFRGAIDAYEAASAEYERSWELASGPAREDVAAGISEVRARLAEAHRRRAGEGDLARAYGHLLSAEEWRAKAGGRAYVRARRGVLLLDMYVAGYEMDDEGNLRWDSSFEREEVLQEPGRRRILEGALEALQGGLSEEESEDDAAGTVLEEPERLSVR